MTDAEPLFGQAFRKIENFEFQMKRFFRHVLIIIEASRA
jgi:hypothetical protein